MSCRNCEDKPSRYQSVATKDIDRPPVEIPSEPYSNFLAARSKSYEDLLKEDQEMLKFLDQQAEAAYLEMSDAMKRRYVEKMVAVANCDEVSPLGANPGQAVRALHKVLNREDFSFILDIYPTLKDQVSFLYSNLDKNKINLL